MFSLAMFLHASPPSPKQHRREEDNCSLSSSSYSSSKSSRDFSRHNSYDGQDEEKRTPQCDTIMKDLPVLPLSPPPYWTLSRSTSPSSPSPAPRLLHDAPISSRTRRKSERMSQLQKPLPPLPKGKSVRFSIQKPLPPLPEGRIKRTNEDIYFCLKELESLESETAFRTLDGSVY